MRRRNSNPSSSIKDPSREDGEETMVTWRSSKGSSSSKVNNHRYSSQDSNTTRTNNMASISSKQPSN
jgi:hypothetical protein